jgi:hypothetical protein
MTNNQTKLMFIDALKDDELRQQMPEVLHSIAEQIDANTFKGGDLYEPLRPARLYG